MSEANGPAVNRPAHTSSACQHNESGRQWTDDAVRLAWESGYAYVMWGPGLPMRLAVIDEARRAIIAPPPRTAQQRVRERAVQFEQCAADLARRMGRPRGYLYCGGPVGWEQP